MKNSKTTGNSTEFYDAVNELKILHNLSGKESLRSHYPTPKRTTK
jgi:hypothetical protein